MAQDDLGLDWPSMHRELGADLASAFGSLGAGQRGVGFGSLGSWSNAAPFGSLGAGGDGGSFGSLGERSSSDPWHGLKEGFADIGLTAAQKAAKRNPDPNAVQGVSKTLTESGPATNVSGLGSSKWAGIINEEAAKYADAPELAEVAQAVMELESKGNEGAQGVVVTEGAYAGQRAQGLMQIMPGNYPGVDLMNPRTNIKNGVAMLYERYKRYGSWDKAAASYLGAVDANGNITGAQDDNGTDGYAYVNIVNKHRATIRNARQLTGTGGLTLILGGAPATVTQELGAVTPGIDQSIYTYGQQYGLAQGHTGIDIGVKRGTKLYMPQGGVVETAGGTTYFLDEDYGDKGTPGKGELRVKLDNGWVLIFGHNSQITVRAGQRVNAGDLVALSGSANGDHLHLELRIPDKSTASGFRVVDPRQYLGVQQPTPGGGGRGHEYPR